MSKDSNEILSEVKEIEGKNSEVLTKLKKLFDDANLQKQARGAETIIVKNIVGKLTELRKELQELTAKLSQFEKEVVPTCREFGSPESIKKQIDALEYSLHLNYSPSREKTTAKRVKELNEQLKKIEKNIPKLKELSELRKTLRELKGKISESVQELKKHAAKSEEHHRAMLKNLQEAKQLQSSLSLSELDEKRKAFVKVSAEERVMKKKNLDAKKKQTRFKTDKKMQEVKAKAEEILERFKLGKKISFEELQVLQASGIEL